MAKSNDMYLSRRERQIMDIIYQLGEASVHDVLERLPDPPGYNSVRTILKILEDKKMLMHHRKGQQYIYVPTIVRDKAKRSALAHLRETFFAGSTPKVVSTLLDMSLGDLDKAELDELARMIENARKEKK